jgi:hypothetical protein
LQQKAELEVRLRLVDELTNQVQAAEKALLNARIGSINEVIRREEQSVQNRIRLIEKLGQTTAGIEFLEEEFKPSQLVEREFGLVGGLIVEELDKSTTTAINRMVQKIKIMEKSGVDTFELLSTTQQAFAQATARLEEDTAEKREIVLEKLERSAGVVTKAEEDLIAARNKIPALNAKIIDAQKKLSSANKQVSDAQQQLSDANQTYADAQAQLTFDIGLARVQALQSTGAFRGAGEQIGALSSIFQKMTREVRASENAILQIRRQILQEELNIVRSQFDTFKSLALEAATGGVETVSRLRRQLSAAQRIAAAGEVAGIPPDLLQGIERFANVVPGLEQALLKTGAEALGLDPELFKSLESQIVSLAEGIAETGKVQVNQAAEQLQAARDQLTEAEEQKKIAEEELQVAIGIKDAAVQNVREMAANALFVRTGFAEANDIAIKQLRKLEEGTSTNIDALGAIKQLESLQEQQLNEVRKSRTDSLQKFNQLIAEAKAIRAAIGSAGAATSTLTTIVKRTLGTVAQAAAAAAGAPIPTVARGSLRRSEFSSLLNAARREKQMMPPGAKLMLANTSEVVFNRQQAKQLGFSPKPQAFAQAGNAAGNFENALNTFAAATSALLTRLNDPGFVQQNINVQVDSQRRVDVRGLEGIETAVRNSFQERIGGLATREEQRAISDVVQSVVSKLNEQGIVNTQGF